MYIDLYLVISLQIKQMAFLADIHVNNLHKITDFLAVYLHFKKEQTITLF